MLLAGPASLVALLWVAPAAAAPIAPAPVPEPFRSLAACESDLTWDEGDGGLGPFRGGLQWHPDTWAAAKPAGAPADPGRRHPRTGGLAEPWGSFHHWPVCARKLGLIGADRG